MKLKQALMPKTESKVSEVTILVFSFIAAFSAGIIIISALFVTVRKIESKLSTPFDITYTLHR